MQVTINYTSFSIKFNILIVALIAAEAWSESRPRVLNSRSFNQVMVVSTKASVRPPGGIQLTDAIEALMQEQPVHGYEFEGKRHDAGTTMGWLKATIELALERPDLGTELRAHLQSLEL
jgi:UTP--glucose-1-phosphate uridylyltransferase